MREPDSLRDLETRYHRAQRDPLRGIDDFLELSLRYGRALLADAPERADEVFAAASELVRDPPSGSHLPVAVELASGLASARRRLGDPDGEREARLLQRRLLGLLPIDDSWERLSAVSRRVAWLDISAGRVDDGLLTLVSLLAEVVSGGSDHRFDGAALSLTIGVNSVIAGPAVSRAIEALLPAARSGPERAAREASLTAVLAALHLSSGDVEVASIYARRSEVLCDRAPSPPIVCRWVGAMVHLAAGDVDEALDGYETLVRSLPVASPPELRCEVLGGLGEARLAAGLRTAGREALTECLVNPLGGERRMARAHELLAELDREDGRLADAYDHLVECRRLEAGFLVRTARAADRREAVDEPLAGTEVPPVEAFSEGEERSVVSPFAGSAAIGPLSLPSGLEAPPEDLQPRPRSAELVPIVPDHVELPEHLVEEELGDRVSSLEELVDARTRELEQALIDLRDLTQRSELDELTGLMNRSRLRSVLAEMAEHGTVVSILSIDVDRFGRVNESLGHTVGDALLEEIARRIRRVIRADDLVGRWGGDEFVVVLVDLVDPDQVMDLATRVSEVVALPWRAPTDERVVPSVSIGVVTAPEGVADGDLVLRQADAARRRAKRSGSGRVEWFGHELSDVARRRFQTEHLLRDALAEGWFELYFQPVHPNFDDDPLSAEALLRLHHPDGHLLSPGAFLDVAEETGLARPIGAWVVDETVRTAARWSRLGTPFRVALNVSASQLDDGFADLVTDALDRYGVAPQRLTLELTEHTLLEADARQVSIITELCDRGVGLALDDFGTAYSSLNHLRRFPVDVVKIDRSFVNGICHDPYDHAIVAAVVQLSQTFGFRVIAEGIETAEQLDAQRRLGCHGAQGFLIGPPRPAHAFERLLTSRQLVGLLLARTA